MDNRTITEFIRKQKVAFICSVDEEGFPNVKAMLRPRKTDGLHRFYFSTNTSSMRVKQYMNNPNACIYFYHKGLIKYTGVMLKGRCKRSHATPACASGVPKGSGSWYNIRNRKKLYYGYRGDTI